MNTHEQGGEKELLEIPLIAAELLATCGLFPSLCPYFQMYA